MDESTILSNASPQAEAVLDMFTIVMLIAGFVFLIVLTFVIINIIRFRRSKVSGTPHQNPGNPKLETLWTIGPALTLGFIFFLAVRTMNITEPPPKSHAVNLIITANQWWWKGEYLPDSVVVANEFHWPVDSLWLLEILSADVDHDFWVPALGPKVDAIPNHPNHIWMQPTDTGTYQGMCAEFCGAEHAWMRFLVVVEPRAAYDAWLKHQAQPAPFPTDSLEVAGFRTFVSMTCRNCHTIRGTGSNGIVGPDLTHVATRRRLAGGVFDNTPKNLAIWLHNPQAVKPGCHMPNLDLTNSQVHALVAYLETLK